MFANTDFYRTSWTGKMLDYAYTDYNLTAVTGMLELLAAGTTNLAVESGDGPFYGTVNITGKQQVNIEACKSDLNLTAGWKDINIKATCVSSPEVLGGRINMETTANTVTGSGVFSLTSDSDIEVKSTLGHISIEAIKDTDGVINIKAAEDIVVDWIILNNYSMYYEEYFSSINS